MTVIASAPVPASRRLIDAPTAAPTAVRRDVALIERAARRNPAGVRQVAEAIRTGCPPWCSSDHRGQVTDVEGFTLGLVHERIVTEATGLDPATVADPATAAVFVESTTEAGEVVTGPRVVLTVAEGAEGAHPGEQDCQGWTGTPEQARALAAALLAAAELVEGGAR